MRGLAYSQLFALGLILAGCGGGKSTFAPTAATPSILSVSKYAIPAGTTDYQMYISAVDDNGVSYGSLGPVPMGTVTAASPAAYWPTPSSYVTVPVLDSSVYSETLVGKSPGGAILVGYTYDADNSEGPGRGFAYTSATQQFHVLAITVSGGSQLFVNPQSVTDAGVVSGNLTYRTSTGEGGAKRFTYNLDDDSFQLSDDTFVQTVNGVFVETWSQNGNYFGGTSNNAPAIYNGSTASLVSMDAADPECLVMFVSNDASVAVIRKSASIGAGSPPQDAEVWFPGKGTVSTYALVNQSEPGVFNGTAMLVGSPLGHYITIGNLSEGGSLTRLVHVK